MKIVLIEDSSGFREGFKRNLQRLPGYQKQRDLIEGGLYDDSKRVLQNLKIQLGEPIFLIVDGNLDYSEDDRALPGNGFNLVNNWLTSLIKGYRDEGKEKEIENLSKNLTIMLNPTEESFLEEDFRPYAELKKICQGVISHLEGFTKGEGPKRITEMIDQFSQQKESPGGVNFERK